MTYQATSFGKNLREFRELLEMTQLELSQRAKLTPAAVNQIEKGLREPSLKTIVAILNVIPVKFERLVRQEN